MLTFYALFDVFHSQPRISSAAWWKKIQPSVSRANRPSDTPGEKRTQNKSYRGSPKIRYRSNKMRVSVCQDRRGYSALQEHPWVSQQTDQEELCQEQMEGMCCWVFVVLALSQQTLVFLHYGSLIDCLVRSWITGQLSPHSPDVQEWTLIIHFCLEEEDDDSVFMKN